MQCSVHEHDDDYALSPGVYSDFVDSAVAEATAIASTEATAVDLTDMCFSFIKFDRLHIIYNEGLTGPQVLHHLQEAL